jgi:hypothetical protein
MNEGIVAQPALWREECGFLEPKCLLRMYSEERERM